MDHECNCVLDEMQNLNNGTKQQLLCETDLECKVPYNVELAMQVAKQFLLDHDLVCFQDDLFSCAKRIKEMIGKPHLAGGIPKLNVGSKRKSKNKETSNDMITLDRINGTLIENDILLYHWAKEAFGVQYI